MLTIELKDALSEFDPFHTELTPDIQFKIGPTLQQIKPFLAGLSIEDMRAILCRSEQSFAKARDLATPALIEMVNSKNESVFNTDCFCLYLAKDQLQDEIIGNFNFTWSEVFSTIAAGYLGLYYKIITAPRPTTEEIITLHFSNYENFPEMQQELAGNFLHHYEQLKENAVRFSMEALGFAKDAISESSKAKRLKASKAAKKEKYQDAKRWVYQEYQDLYTALKQKGEKISNDNAAYKLHSEFPIEALGPLNDPPSYRTISNWIGEYKNQKAELPPGTTPFQP